MPEPGSALPPAAARRLFLLGLVGPAFLVLAAVCAALAKNELDVPLGAYVLSLLDRDLAGLTIVFAAAGAACVLALAWAHRSWRSEQRRTSGLRFAAAAMALFVLLFLPLLVFWPSPPIRLSFIPVDPGALAVYRVYVRGLKHGPYPLESSGPPLLVASAGAPDGTITCAIAKAVSFGPFGWARDLDARWSGSTRELPEPAAMDTQALCHKGVDLSSISADARARELLEPFVYGNRVVFTPEQVAAAKGSTVDVDALDGMGLYLQFKRSPGNSGSKYEPADHAYAVYRCDAAYAQFLDAMGAYAPHGLVQLLRSIRPGDIDGALDARSWRGRVDPMTTLASAPHLVPLSEAVQSPACAAMLAHYVADESIRPSQPDPPRIELPAPPPVRPFRRR